MNTFPPPPNNQYQSDIFKQLEKYNMVDGLHAAVQPILGIMTVYFIIICVYMFKYHTHNSVFHWTVLILSFAMMIMALINPWKSWVKCVSIGLCILVILTYMIPYTDTSEIIMHPVLKMITSIFLAVLIIFQMGVLLALHPSTAEIGQWIMTHSYF